MTEMLALDIETTNFSHEIGGWGNTHMFEPSVVATWDGEQGTVYANENVEKFLPEGTVIKPLHPKTLGEDLAKHVADGGLVLGHNLKGFDLPVLRDSLDCWTAGDLLSKSIEQIFDTSFLLRSIIGHAVPLSDACYHTLNKGKLMNSHDAPIEWRKGNYSKVAEYCLKDAELVYELWKHGVDEGFVKARSRTDGVIKEFEVDW
jgi:DEAD/DEAH box helicase domain-containing protein